MPAIIFNELAAAEVFLQVVRAQGYSAAAKALGRSASSLSRAVVDLERHLGAQLLVRTTRRLHLTEAGAAYLPHAEALTTASRAGRDAITELVGGAPRGRLRVSMPVSVGERVLADHLPEFHRRYPELRLEIDLSDRPVPLVEGAFDLVIRVGKPPDSSLRGQLLGRVRSLLVASPSYLAECGAPAHPKELSNHACLSVRSRSGPAVWSFHGGDQRESVTVDGIVWTTSPTVGSKLAVAGLGILRTIEWTIRDELASGALVEVMPEWSCDHPTRGGVPVYVLYAQSANVAPPLKSRVFVELVKKLVAAEIDPPRVPGPLTSG